MSCNNAYELMKRMWEIDAKIEFLSGELKRASRIEDRNRIEKEMDNLYCEFLKGKHYLEDLGINNPFSS